MQPVIITARAKLSKRSRRRTGFGLLQGRHHAPRRCGHASRR